MTEAAVARLFGVTKRALCRWDKNAKLGFPRPIHINGRRYRDAARVHAFLAARMEASAPPPRIQNPAQVALKKTEKEKPRRRTKPRAEAQARGAA
jgi:hypothetical protein